VTDAIDAGYWRDVMGAEFESLPRLSLSLAQAQRLWGITEAMARRVLESYVATGYLTQTPDGHYQRTDYASAAARVHHA
jgi:Fic family protein